MNIFVNKLDNTMEDEDIVLTNIMGRYELYAVENILNDTTLLDLSFYKGKMSYTEYGTKLSCFENYNIEYKFIFIGDKNTKFIFGDIDGNGIYAGDDDEIYTCINDCVYNAFSMQRVINIEHIRFAKIYHTPILTDKYIMEDFFNNRNTIPLNINFVYDSNNCIPEVKSLDYRKSTDTLISILKKAKSIDRDTKYVLGLGKWMDSDHKDLKILSTNTVVDSCIGKNYWFSDIHCTYTILNNILCRSTYNYDDIDFDVIIKGYVENGSVIVTGLYDYKGSISDLKNEKYLTF